MPSLIKDKVVFLDLGANVECDANNLVQFAIMGNAFAKVVLGRKKPKIGLLNIGSEDFKGNDRIKSAWAILNRLSEHGDIDFYGYIEGNQINAGDVDVIVTDGFTGNVALKTVEGTAKLSRHFLEKGFKYNILSKIGYLLAKTALKKVMAQLDPRIYNGAMFVGLNGVVLKSHGSSDGVAFANALNTTISLVANNINEQIIDTLRSTDLDQDNILEKSTKLVKDGA